MATGAGPDDPLVHSRNLNGLPHYLALRGLDYSTLAHRAGIADADTTATDTYVPLDAFTHVLEQAADATKDDSFALRWTAQDEGSSHGSLALCLRYAPTLRIALETLLQFVTLQIDVSMPTVRVDGGAAIFSWSYSPLVRRQNQTADRDACLFISWLCANLPRSEHPVEVKLMRPRPKSAVLHRSLLAPNLVFGAERNEICFAEHSLTLHNPAADPHLFNALCELNVRLLIERRRRDDFVLRVREEIIGMGKLNEGVVAVDSIARRLGMSTRGLQRRLSASGTTFHQLLDDLRRDAAKIMLAETDLLVSEIAYRLGFSSIGNFTRAAKRWYGMPPREFRGRMQSTSEGR